MNVRYCTVCVISCGFMFVCTGVCMMFVSGWLNLFVCFVCNSLCGVAWLVCFVCLSPHVCVFGFVSVFVCSVCVIYRVVLSGV